LYFAFTRYQQLVDLRPPELVETTLFSRYGQIALALVMMGAAAVIVWRLAHREARLESDRRLQVAFAAPRVTWSLPAGLGPGASPGSGWRRSSPSRTTAHASARPTTATSSCATVPGVAVRSPGRRAPRARSRRPTAGSSSRPIAMSAR